MPSKLSAFRAPLLLALAALGANIVLAQPPRTMAAILDASAPADWRTPAADDLLVLELDRGQVVIELAPDYAPEHVANLRTLAREGYFDGLSINRAQDNFVVQWGDANADDPATRRSLGSARERLPAEFSAPISDGLAFTRLPDADGWAPEVGFDRGFPVARDPASRRQWLAHCYAAVGAGRGDAADSSNGTELYVVIGQAPRQLDLNITVVGRVLQGIELLAALPRSSAPGGFYAQPALRTPIRSVTLASALPAAAQPRLQVLRTDTAAFAELVESRRNRPDAWYLRRAGHIDLCNVPLPMRKVPNRG